MKFLKIGLAAALSASLCPALAYAAPLETAAQVDLQAETAATETPATQKIVVLSKITETTKKSGKKTETKTSTFTYNKTTGLLTKRTAVDKKKKVKKTTITTKWTYNSDNQLTKVASTSKGGVKSSTKSTFTLDDNGNITKETQPSGKTNTFTTSFKYKSGKVSTATDEIRYKPKGKSYVTWPLGTSTYSYDGDRVSSIVNTRTGTTQFTYDDNGNIKQSKSKTPKGKFVPTNFTNTYSATTGNLTKQVAKTSKSKVTVTRTYKYKTITVPTAFATRVENQRWALLNQNNNFAIGTTKTQ